MTKTKIAGIVGGVVVTALGLFYASGVDLVSAFCEGAEQPLIEIPAE